MPIEIKTSVLLNQMATMCGHGQSTEQDMDDMFEYCKTKIVSLDMEEFVEKAAKNGICAAERLSDSGFAREVFARATLAQVRHVDAVKAVLAKRPDLIDEQIGGMSPFQFFWHSSFSCGATALLAMFPAKCAGWVKSQAEFNDVFTHAVNNTRLFAVALVRAYPEYARASDQTRTKWLVDQTVANGEVASLKTLCEVLGRDVIISRNGLMKSCCDRASTQTQVDICQYLLSVGVVPDKVAIAAFETCASLNEFAAKCYELVSTDISVYINDHGEKIHRLSYNRVTRRVRLERMYWNGIQYHTSEHDAYVKDGVMHIVFEEETKVGSCDPTKYRVVEITRKD